MSILMRIATKTAFIPEKMFGWMHEHRIDWNAVVVVPR
jgi:hypothetical protein